MNDLGNLRLAILKIHGTHSVHVGTVSVHELLQGKTAWKGEVEVFSVADHPSGARLCYAWSYQDDGGRTQYRVVLKAPPINSPEDAVKASEERKDM